MSFGDFSGDKDLRQAWHSFCEQLKVAGEEAFKDYNPPTAGHRVDAFRFLTQNLGQAFDLSLETKHTKFPVIHAFCSPFCKLGGDNADYTYQQAWVDGQSIYKISGNRGTARFLNFAVQGPRPELHAGSTHRNLHEPFGDVPECNLFGQDLKSNWDGSFELYIGGPKQGQNWLPTTPGTRKLFLRQGFDRWDELPARFRIERIDMSEPRPVPSPTELITAMQWAGNFVTGLMKDNPDWPYEYAADCTPELINAFPTKRRQIDQPVYNVAKDRLRGRAPSVMVWKLKSDEALIVEFEPKVEFWMMTNMGVYFNSMDFLYRPISYTPSRTTIDSDGKVRLILAHTDPGYHNWVDTQGFELGHLANRNMFTDQWTEFHTRVVKHAELANALPADSAKVTPDERAGQLKARFHAIMQRYVL